MSSAIQTALHLIYPSRCTSCGIPVEQDFALCGPCWGDTAFISGLVCDRCGVPLPDGGTGGAQEDGTLCDDCIAQARPWARGRAALVYRGTGRSLLLALKHGDRPDIARAAAPWMARAAQPLLVPGMLVAPVPLHWSRLLRRRYNQAALLAQGVGRVLGMECCPDLLIRPRRTPSLGHMGRDERHTLMQGAIAPHPRRGARAQGREVLLVDDVMTSGATLSAATQACLAAGASGVCILTLARVALDA